ncbi:MAG: hypothetical protein Q4C06_07940 [Bacillota bacterium]|nr:hypothetical protein [Bacillota bacterium]
MKKLAFLVSCLLCCSVAACGTAQEPAPETENTEVSAEAAVIAPLPSAIDMANLTDCTVAVGIEEGGIYTAEDGKVMMDVTVYDHEVFDMVDIAQMKEGDTIVISGYEEVIDTLERTEDGAVLINGGMIDEGGHALYSNDNTVFAERGFDDSYILFEAGKTTLPVSADFTFTDASNLESDPVTYTMDQLLDPASGIDFFFVGTNTEIVIQGGEVVSMNRIYIP